MNSYTETLNTLRHLRMAVNDVFITARAYEQLEDLDGICATIALTFQFSPERIPASHNDRYSDPVYLIDEVHALAEQCSWNLNIPTTGTRFIELVTDRNFRGALIFSSNERGLGHVIGIQGTMIPIMTEDPTSLIFDPEFTVVDTKSEDLVNHLSLSELFNLYSQSAINDYGQRVVIVFTSQTEE